MKKIALMTVLFAIATSSAFAGGATTTQPTVNTVTVLQPTTSGYVSQEYVNQLSLDFVKSELKKRFVDVEEIEEWALRSVYFLISNNCVTIVGDRIAGQDFNVPQAPKTTIRGAQSDKASRPETFKLLAELASNILFGKCSAGAFSNIDQLKVSQDILRITDKNLGDELTKLKAQLEVLKNRPDGDQVARDALSQLQNDYISLANLRFEIAGNYDKLNVRILSLGEELALQRREIDELKARKPINGQAGAAGLQGPAGSNGASGAKGDTGSQGLTGTPGQKGDKGDIGTSGQNGAQGQQGSAGRDGKDGQTVYIPAPAAPAAPVTVTNTNTLTVNVYGGVATTAPDGKTVDVRMPAVITPSVIPAKPVFVCNGDSRVLSTVQVCISPVEICFFLFDGAPVTMLRYEAANGGYIYYLANGAQVLVTRVQGGLSVQQIR